MAAMKRHATQAVVHVRVEVQLAVVVAHAVRAVVQVEVHAALEEVAAEAVVEDNIESR